jgi:hypothetical protein
MRCTNIILEEEEEEEEAKRGRGTGHKTGRARMGMAALFCDIPR